MTNTERTASRRAFSINSALAFAAAELVTSALHEVGHGLNAQFLGFSPYIYAFHEENPSGNARETLPIVAAGPVTSLVLGSLFYAWYRRSMPRYSYARLLLSWLALIGVMEFVNYLIVAPWLADGDTARFTELLRWPPSARYVMMATGIGVTVLLARPAAGVMFAAAPRSIALDIPRARRRFIAQNVAVPLLVGVALTAVAGVGSAPSYVAYGLLGTLGTIDVVFSALCASGAPLHCLERMGDAALRIEPMAFAVYGGLVSLYVLAFARGVPI